MPDVEGSFRPRLPGSGPFLPPAPIIVPLSQAMWVDPGTVVPAESQDGSAGAPFAAIQTAVDALAAKVQGAIVLAPGVYPAEAVTIGTTEITLLGLGSRESGCDLDLVTIAAVAALSICNLALLGAVTSTGPVSYRDTTSAAAVSASNLSLVDSTVGTVNVVGSITAQNGTFTNGGICFNLNAWDSSFGFLDTTWTVANGELHNSDFSTDVSATNFQFRDCTIAGVFNVEDFRAFNTHFGGGSVSALQIFVDLFTYSRRPPSQWVAFTGIFIQDAPWTPSIEQIGYAAGAPSDLFTVLVANNHAPGIYLIYAPIVVRTVAGAGSLTRTISWSAPTIGAQTLVTAGTVITSLGTKFQDASVIVSDGLADVTVRYAPVGVAGAPVIDIYAASLQGGANIA